MSAYYNMGPAEQCFQDSFRIIVSFKSYFYLGIWEILFDMKTEIHNIFINS